MILVDTSIWIDFLIDPARVPGAQHRIKNFATCGPIVQEILQGFSAGPAYPQFLERLLTFPRLSDPLPVDLYVQGASIYREGRGKGYTIRSPYDCLIAAIAIHHDIPVWHRDRDFTTIAKFTPLKIFSLHLM